MIGILVWLAVGQESDAEAAAIYAKVVAKLKVVKTISGKVDVVTIPGQEPVKFTFRAMKPNFLRMESKSECYYVDGKNDFAYIPEIKEYNKGEAEPDSIGALWLNGFESFLGGTQPEWQFFKATMQETQGKKLYTLRMTQKEIIGMESRLIIDAATWLPVRWESIFEGGEKIWGKYSELKLDEPMKPEEFKWTPPKDAKLAGDGVSFFSQHSFR